MYQLNYEEIKNKMNGIMNMNLKGDGEWTYEIKRIFTEIGNKEGYYVFTNKVEGAKHGEWLYDLMWNDYNNKYLIDSILAIITVQNNHIKTN